MIAATIARQPSLAKRRNHCAELAKPKLAATSPPSPKASARQPSLAKRPTTVLACQAEARGNKPAFAEGFGAAAFSRFASEGWWGRQDSNLRSHKTADLQSAPFATRDTPPLPRHGNP